MHFSAKTLLAVFSATLLAGVRADDCSDGPVDSFVGWGKKGYNPNTPFCQTKWKAGLVVTGLEAWATKYHVSGVQFTYSDGSKGAVIGNTVFGDNKNGDNSEGGDGKHFAINWGAEDKITKMECATSKDGKALGLINIEVAGKKLSVGSVSDGDSVSTASGLLLGASGETNAFPSYFTPLFMGVNNNEAEIIDIKFDEDLAEVNKKQEGMKSVTLNEVYIKNTNPIDPAANNTAQGWTFVGSVAKTKTSSLSTTKTNTFSISQSIEIGGKIGLPFVAEGSISSTTGAEYSYSTATEKMKSDSETFTLTWSQLATQTQDLIMPGHAKHCTAKSVEGNYHGDYTSTVQITVSGKKFTFQQRGTFDSVSYTDAQSECKDVLIKDIPGSSKQVNAASTMKGKRQVAFLA